MPLAPGPRSFVPLITGDADGFSAAYSSTEISTAVGRPCFSMTTAPVRATSRYLPTCRLKSVALVVTASAMIPSGTIKHDPDVLVRRPGEACLDQVEDHMCSSGEGQRACSRSACIGGLGVAWDWTLRGPLARLPPVGVTFAKVRVSNPRGARARAVELDFLIDTGAITSVVPASVLRKLGIERLERQEVTLADRTKQAYAVGEAFFKLGQKGGTSKVIFAPEGVTPLLGAPHGESRDARADVDPPHAGRRCSHGLSCGGRP